MNRIAAAALFLCACAAQENKRLVVPDGMRRQTQPLPRPENKPARASLQGALQPAATATPTKTGDGRYLLRLAEHNRLWELELPESAGGYEMRIPLDGPLDAPTAADSELLASAREADGTNDRPAVDAGARTKAKNVEATTASVSRAEPATASTAVARSDASTQAEPIATPRRKSYLGTLARVREMYSSRKYEMALVELVDLEPSYPNDERVQAMKGSLYLKLGKPQLARESWQKALALDPDDAAVAEALRNLKEE